MLLKAYGPAPSEDATRYSPPRCIGATRKAILGSPAESETSTSHVERQNLTLPCPAAGSPG